MTDKLIFSPARREKIGLVIGLSGPSGSGKTLTSLRLSRGIAGANGRVAMLDTESGRGLIYADDVQFDHAPLHEPFSPDRYAEAAAISKRAGHDVLIIDSMTHEWVGAGGVLEMQAAELEKLAGNDFARREAMTMVSWIRPKGSHKAMVNRLLQLNSHLILNFRAEEKTEIQKLPNKQGKLVNTPVNIGFQPITSKQMIYELTIFLGFDPKNPGVAIPLKVPDKLRHLVPLDRPIDEEVGRRLAEWASGKSAASRLPRAAPQPPPETGQAVPPPTEQQADPPPSSESPPPDPPPPLSKNEVVLNELIAMFGEVKERADHFKIVDTKKYQDRIAWFKKNKPTDLYPVLAKAIQESWDRTEPVPAPGTEQQEPAG